MLYGKCTDATEEGVEGLFDAVSRLASSEAVQVETRPVLLLTYLVERPATTTTMQPTTTTKRQTTTRTAVTGTVFVRTTYAVTTTVDSVTLQRDLTSVIAVVLTKAGVPVTLAEVVVLVEQLALARRSNNWRASVFVQVAQGRAQVTKDALQTIQDDQTIEQELRVRLSGIPTASADGSPTELGLIGFGYVYVSTCDKPRSPNDGRL
jgi:hypothetical protein